MQEDKMIQKGFSSQWKNSEIIKIVSNNDFFSMRDWQIQAFEQLKDASYMILNAPMGGGKSWLMCFLSAYKMKQNFQLRSIIAVPQTIIASGFVEAKIIMPDGEKLHWNIKHNLCDNNVSGIKPVRDFIQWLENPLQDLNERSVLCTHATIIAAYKKLKATDKLHLLNNLCLWIDESHHIKNVETEKLNSAVINNALGEIVAYFLDDQYNNLQLGLTTASFFRGDRTTLLTDSMEQKFTRFNLPYDQYLRSMKHLRSFSFDFLLCGNDYIKGIEKLLKARTAKDIIYIPYRNSILSTDDKHQEVQDIIQLYGNILDMTQDGVIIVQGPTKKYKILNLVDNNLRKQKKQYLADPKFKENHSALDSIIALGMCKEGFNSPFTDRSIIVGARASLVDVIQMAGRLFRDTPNKHHVEVIQLLPFSLDQQDKELFRENLNNYLKAVYASLILENILNPIKIQSMQKAETDKKEIKEKNDQTNWLNIMLPDDAKQQQLIENVGNHLIDIMENKPVTVKNVQLLQEEYHKIVPKIMEEHDINQYQQEVAQQIWSTLTRRTMQIQGISVENIDFNIVQEAHPLEFLLKYTSGICDVTTFDKLREAIGQSRIPTLPFEEARKIARSFNLKTRDQWMKHAQQRLLPQGIPNAPHRVYDLWAGWADWLGTSTIANQNRKFLTHEQAQIFIQPFNFKTQKEYSIWAKSDHRPVNMPAYPNEVYKNSGWTSWGAFLKTDNVANKYSKMRPFFEAKEYIQSLGFKSVADYRTWAKTKNRNKDIPAAPDRIYKNQGWTSWVDWLGY